MTPDMVSSDVQGPPNPAWGTATTIQMASTITFLELRFVHILRENVRFLNLGVLLQKEWIVTPKSHVIYANMPQKIQCHLIPPVETRYGCQILLGFTNNSIHEYNRFCPSYISQPLKTFYYNLFKATQNSKNFEGTQKKKVF